LHGWRHVLHVLLNLDDLHPAAHEPLGEHPAVPDVCPGGWDLIGFIRRQQLRLNKVIVDNFARRSVKILLIDPAVIRYAVPADTLLHAVFRNPRFHDKTPLVKTILRREKIHHTRQVGCAGQVDSRVALLAYKFRAPPVSSCLVPQSERLPTNTLCTDPLIKPEPSKKTLCRLAIAGQERLLSQCFNTDGMAKGWIHLIPKVFIENIDVL